MRVERSAIGLKRDIPGAVECAEPRGAFYAYPNIGVALGKHGIDDTLTFCDRLLHEANVAVVPGEAFGPTSTYASPTRLPCTSSSAAWTAFTSSL